MPWWTWAAPLLAWIILIIHFLVGVNPLIDVASTIALIATVFAAVYHAEVVAHRVGEPFGTLVLAIAVTIIEVALIVSVMIGGGPDKATLARDTVFAAVMIVCNGIIGLCLLAGGIRHFEQGFHVQGAGAALAVLAALTVLSLVLPNFTTSLSGPRFTEVQEIFLITVTILLYAIFLFIQTRRHRGYFKDKKDESNSEDHTPKNLRSGGFHAVMLVLYLIVVIVLAEKFAIPLDNCIERFGIPQAFGGAIIAALVFAPEALAAIQAATRNHLQRAVNVLHGSVLASISLTIPAVLIIGLFTKRQVILGVEGGNLPLLVLTLATSIVTFGSGRTNILQGCIHLVLFAVFLMLIFYP